MPKIALIYDILRWEEKAILKAAKEKAIELKLIHVKSNPLFIQGRFNEYHQDFDIGLQRCISHYNALESALVFEALGHRIINNSISIAISNDKVWTTSKLVQYNIPTPKTALAFNEEQALRVAKMLKYPVVIKPINGSWGRLVSLADDEEDLRSIIEHREYLASPHSKIHYIQEFVRKPGRDVRVFVIGEEVPVAIYRVSKHWITNTARGGKAVPAPIDNQLEDLAIRTAKAVNGEILGIDILEDPQRGYLVNEVNSVPEFKNTVAVTGYNLPKKIIEYLISLVKK